MRGGLRGFVGAVAVAVATVVAVAVPGASAAPSSGSGSPWGAPTTGQRSGIASAAVAAAGLLPARLRSPRLQDSCPSGFTYGEHEIGAMRIEGCSRDAATRKRPDQRAFRGELELNGLLVSAVGTDEFSAWTDTSLVRNGIRYDMSTVAHLKRDADTRLHLDATIAGAPVRFRIYQGPIHLQAGSGPYVHQGVTQPEGTMDIPVNGAAALLGLRLRSSIEDAQLDPDGMSFPLTLSMGSGAPQLLREETGTAQVRLVDGSGMRLTGLDFRVRRIELPGIGGMRDLRVAYDEGRNRWGGEVQLALGELFGGQEFTFAMEVDADTGIPTYIRLAVDDMNFPIGQSGIFLQGARAEFGLDPFLVGAGLTATAGPQVAGISLIEMGGDLQLVFEPGFRLDAVGTARILPTGPSSQLGTGRIEFTYDAEGYVRIAHRQRYEALIAGIGPAAEITGEGSYATDRNRFNVEASATGRLELGALGGFDVVSLGAVVSSDGWGACGSLAPAPFGFLSGGIGQDWDRGMQVIMGCDLSPFSAEVRRGDRAATQQTFTVPAGVRTVAVAVRGAAPGPRFRVTAPGGRFVDIEPVRGTAGPFGATRVAWLGSAESDTTFVFLSNPPAGTYTIRWPSDGTPIVGVRTATSAPRIKAQASVARAGAPGQRRLSVRITSGLGPGEQLAVAIVGRDGAVPVGLVGGGAALRTAVSEIGTGPRRIVGQVVRDGIPVPGRTVVLGRYRATPPPPPASIRVARVGTTPTVRVTAIPARGAERPDGWAYVVQALGQRESFRTGLGEAISFAVPARATVRVAAWPVVDGRVLPVRPRVTTVPGV